MKKLLTGLLLTALVAGPALAADLSVKPVPTPVPVFNWSGFYVGGHVGYGWGSYDFQDPYGRLNQPFLIVPAGFTLVVPLARHYDTDGFLGGLQAGVNAQFSSIVVGVEADVSWTKMKGVFRSTSSQLGGLVTTSEGIASQLDWLATARGRIGWAHDRFLVYGTGGVAFGGVQATGDVTLHILPQLLANQNLAFAASDRKTHVGWTAGGGIEGMITPNWSAKIEYLYTDLGWLRHEGPGSVGGTLAPLVSGVSLSGGGDLRLQVQTVKLGLNYRFWGPAGLAMP